MIDGTRLIVGVIVVDLEGWIGQAGDKAASHHLPMKFIDGGRLGWSFGGLGAFGSLAGRLDGHFLRLRELTIDKSVRRRLLPATRCLGRLRAPSRPGRYGMERDRHPVLLRLTTVVGRRHNL
jgi:hypothetical protein